MKFLLRRTLVRSVILFHVSSILTMKLSEIQTAMEDGKSVLDFFLKIKTEVDTYRSLVSSGKRGSVIPICLEEDLDELLLTADNVKKIGYSFLNDEIDSYALSYLADALTLAENISYDNENSKEAICSFADPEINGEITYEKVRKAIETL